MTDSIEAAKELAAILGCSACVMGLLWIAAVATGIWQ